MCQASETSEWKGSVGKEVAGESTINSGKRARKASRENPTRRFVWSPFFGATIGGARGLRRSHAAPQLGQLGRYLNKYRYYVRQRSQAGGMGTLYCRVLAAPPQAPHSSDRRQHLKASSRFPLRVRAVR